MVPCLDVKKEIPSQRAWSIASTLDCVKMVGTTLFFMNRPASDQPSGVFGSFIDGSVVTAGVGCSFGL